MGNKLIQKVSDEFEEMKILVGNFNYEKAKEIYLRIKNELINVKKESEITEISKHMLTKFVNSKQALEFQTLITNLKPKDKLAYLFQLIYENELVESIEKKQVKNDISSNIIINSQTNDSIESKKEEINIKIKRIADVNKYIEFLRFRSIMFENIAEKYFKLGSLIYNSFDKKGTQLSSELQEIIDLFTECIKNYKNTDNQKIKTQEYTNALERAKAHQNILLGKEHIKEEKYLEALNFFQNANYNNSSIIEEKKKGLLLCYEKLAEIEEENNNYEKAIEYNMFLNKNLKIYELKIKINEQNIIEYIKNRNVDKTFDYFSNIFVLLNMAKDRELIELKFSELFDIFLECMIKSSIISYQQNELEKFIQILKNLKKIIENKEISMKVDELILELEKLNKVDENKYFAHIKTTLNSETSEINQRFYISFILIKYLEEKPIDVLTILLKRGIKLSYLNIESFEYLIKLFISKDNLEDLFLISKLFHKIFVSVGILNRVQYFNAIGTKIIEILKIPDVEKDIKFFDVIEYLVLSFQELMMNNTKINKYSEIKKYFIAVLLKNNKFISCIAKGLLFLSSKGIKFEKKIINIIIKSLFENDNDNLLQTIIIQFEIEPKIVKENLNSIYKLLFRYQNIQIKKKDEKIEKIFNFLLNLPEEIISSRLSIDFLEQYMDQPDIHPLSYKLIRRIPIQYRTIKLIQILSNHNENNNNNKKYLKLNKDDMENQFNYMSVISKDDLPQLERNLDEQFYIDRLTFYLNNQKTLFYYLNIEEICNHFSPASKELFILLLENEVKFNDKALLNLLNGFYQDSENQIEETFAIFNKIKQYQGKFPFIIETNLKIEEFLNKKIFENIHSLDIKLIEIFNDFSYLNGFANHHKKYIEYILNLAPEEKKPELLKKATLLLVDKFYDIGTEVFKEILKYIKLDEFINIIPVILSSKDISNKIKELALTKLYNLLLKAENKIEILKTFKFFIDYIVLPNKMIQYLISLLKDKKDFEVYKEILFIFGNYFSTKKNQEKYLILIEEIISEDEKYKNLLELFNSKSKKEILYLYGCLIYGNIIDISNDKDDILNYPINIIYNIITNLNPELDRNLFFKYLQNLNFFYQYEDFSPKRDKVIRKLYFNNKKNSVNKLKLICC